MIYTKTQIDRAVFRAYDIRGIIGTQLNEDVFYTLGLAISSQLYELGLNRIFIARDGRLTSASLGQALQQGFIDSGITVLDLGAVATPVMYYATQSTEVQSGVMITGSHNPSEYNGIKIVLAGRTLVQEDIEKLYATTVAQQYYSGQGKYVKSDISDNYCQRILRGIKLQRSFKVVVDCGNGIAGPMIAKVIAALGCDVVPLYCNVDGNFPNHHPDPSVEENLHDLKLAVATHNADIGLAFDGDADRLGVITEQGEVIWPDRLLMLYACHILAQHKGATIVYDVKCSQHLRTIIEAHGGRAYMCPTGHSIIKAVMQEKDAILAGEMSGHIFFKDGWYGFDDALYSACRLLEMLSQNPETVSVQFNAIPNSVSTPEIKIPMAEELKFNFMQRFCNEAQFPEAKLITIDGLRVEFAKGWGLLRASNTTPCLVARFEAEDEHSLAQIQAIFRTQLQQLNDGLVLSF